MEEHEEIYSWMKFERILPEYFVDEKAEGLFGVYRSHKPKDDLQKRVQTLDVRKQMSRVEKIVRREHCRQSDISDIEDV
ncbi:MAG: hypothetical protein Q8N77_01020 [Nanoarchaeota archaeon]|nr:hypothetical protein [Nanoarchaeota archaeon]